jgi:uncharacterized membrane protein
MSESGRRGEQSPQARSPQDASHDGRPTLHAGEHDRVLHGIEALHDRLARLERLLAPENRGLHQVEQRVVPAWKRVTQGEPRWQVGFAVALAIALQLLLPDRLALLRPTWLLPVLEGLLFAGLIVANPRRIDRESRVIRFVSLALTAVISLANAWSAERLVVELVRGASGDRAGPLLATGGAIWLTNVIVFALWYWEFDRGGPVARMNATRAYPDFQFVQMTSPELAPPDWEPLFGDYLYLSFTNATAFSPTDVMPLSRWAKMTMLLQSAVSLVTVVLVIARAVNILR